MDFDRKAVLPALTAKSLSLQDSPSGGDTQGITKLIVLAGVRHPAIPEPTLSEIQISELLFLPVSAASFLPYTRSTTAAGSI